MTPVEALQQYMVRNRQNVKSMAYKLGISPRNFSDVLCGRRRLTLRSIRLAVKLGIDPAVMLKPFPSEPSEKGSDAKGQ